MEGGRSCEQLEEEAAMEGGEIAGETAAPYPAGSQDQ